METAGSGLCIVFARLAIIVGWLARQLQSEHLFQSEVSLVWVGSTPRDPAGALRVAGSSVATFSGYFGGPVFVDVVQ
jgi:hypothetical protein